MSLPAATTPSIPAMSTQAIERVRALESAVRELPQAEIATGHVIHGGLYARTIRIPAGVVLTGVLIKIPTVVIVNGDVLVATEGEPMHLVGYHVLPASAGRKQAFIANADTDLTMIFPSRAEDVATAEGEFTDEADQLFSHHGENTITITGE
ncbi:hypothetical protein [Oryzomicrobium sp.]|uniref:hypothetical protein n=1 Tax=Oryzomicrobium sp. TaxID=1911578 RepID=UPI002FE18A50